MDRKDSRLNVKECNVNEMVEMILRRLRPIAQKRDIELTMVSMREVYAEIDEVKMVMVITNLVENAIKYNRDHGKVRVTINADPYNFYVSVEDTGVGIPQDSLDKIYERFYRVDKSRSREVGGTGLGLSITKSIILQHHGAIDVSSIEGEGTKFTVTVPLNYVAHPVELRRQSERLRRNEKKRRQAHANTAAAARKKNGAAPGRTSAGSSVKRTAPAAGTAKKASSAGTVKKASAAGTVKKTASAGTAKKTASSGSAKKASSAGTAKKASSQGAVKKTSAGTAAKKTSGSVRTSSGASTAKKTQSSRTGKTSPSGASGEKV